MKKRTLIIMFVATAIVAAAFFLMPRDDPEPVIPPDDPVPAPIRWPAPAHVEVSAIEARFWQQLDGARVRCLLCMHYCIVPAGGVGYVG
jgi:hypothetical protein